MFKIRATALVLAVTGAYGLLGTPAATAAPTLVAIRAAHHLGFDRLVFEFRGGLPAQHSARYVTAVTADPSGKVVQVVGGARLLVRFFAATGHDSRGHLTYGPSWRTYAMPGLIRAPAADPSGRPPGNPAIASVRRFAAPVCRPDSARTGRRPAPGHLQDHWVQQGDDHRPGGTGLPDRRVQQRRVHVHDRR